MPFINGKHYMNPQYGVAMERARQSGKGKFERILGVLADILDELNNSSNGSSSGSSGGGHVRPPRFGGGGSAQESPQDPENPKLRRHRPEVIAIPLARNDAQGEFVEEGQSGERSAQQERQNQTNDSTDGRWVTIDHRHVFIHELSASRRKRHKHPIGEPLPESGQAGIYADMFAGQKTSNGDVFDQKGYTAALLPRSRWHAAPLGTQVGLTHDGKK